MLDQAFEALQKYTWGDDRKQLNPIDEAIVKSQGDKAARAKLEERMIGVLQAINKQHGEFAQNDLRLLQAMGGPLAAHTLRSCLSSWTEDRTGFGAASGLAPQHGDQSLE